MNIAIIGYGRMGHEIEKAALSGGHRIVARIDNEDDWNKATEALKTARVAIEFSTPDTAPDNIGRCFDLHLPVAVGTTGWEARFDHIRQRCEDEKQLLFVSSNFSIGVYLFMATARFLAQKMNPQQAYTPRIEEIHHIRKLDKPSGTALTLSKTVLSQMERLQGRLDIDSLREGDVVGKHTLTFDSDVDRISLTHEAFSRQGFATGAVAAAEWLAARQASGRSGIFGMEDLMGF